MKIRLLLPLVLLSLPTPAAEPPAKSGQDLVDKLLDRIVAGEQAFLDRMRSYRPFMETYVQAAVDEASPASDVRDHYLMGKLQLTADGVYWETFTASDAFQKSPKFRLKLSGQGRFIPEGFAQMIVPDVFQFDRKTYEFEYLRREFLGEVRTLVFDVSPRKDIGGKFVGRIWVEDRDNRIVRANGTYTPYAKDEAYFHFDSWRQEVEPGFWAPAFVYIQDEDFTGQVGARFRAQSRLWNYNRAANDNLDELTAILVEQQDEARDASGSTDSTPLESRRMWERQAQQNVIQRLERAGLVSPRGPVDEVLETVVNNLLASNGLAYDVECRVLLTTPLETFSIGQAIVISRGLIDVLPDEASLAMALADELGHIVLGHPVETMYAFSDYTIFDDAEILARMRLQRTPEQRAAAGRKALELLRHSPYGEQLGNAALFLSALRDRAPMLPNLIQSNFGNALGSAERMDRLQDLVSKAPEGSEAPIAALPLGSRIELNPWTNRISLKENKPVELRGEQDLMPFEAGPFMPYLKRAPR
ncbi:MAG: hypothetical protein GC160_12360 [Acidobacteria bacterium]|nr:hypothetical protein [Acidobacteriota bacterium]